MRALVGMCLLSAGCFYLDPLNKDPTIRTTCDFADGRPCHTDIDVLPGDRLLLRMFVSDADGNLDASTYGWTANTCTGQNGNGCGPYEAQHYDEQQELGVALDIPTMPPADIRSISIDFEARDDRGGIGKAVMVFHLVRASLRDPSDPRDPRDPRDPLDQ